MWLIKLLGQISNYKNSFFSMETSNCYKTISQFKVTLCRAHYSLGWISQFNYLYLSGHK